MKLLFITQKLDKDDSLLGVYHRWVQALSKKLEGVEVICLQKGRVELAENVSVYSLGKETGRSRAKYIWRFYKYLWQTNKEYDVVFVHMNYEYILLGWPFWRMRRKRIFFWYNHPQAHIKAKIAFWLADKLFYTSSHSASSKYSKAMQMPVGIDTASFKRDDKIVAKPNSLLYLGRISPIKKIEEIIKAAEHLYRKGTSFSLDIVGSPASKEDKDYLKSLYKEGENLKGAGAIKFLPALSNTSAPEVYNRHELVINLTPAGSFDKVIIEAMACQRLVIVSHDSLKDILPKLFISQQESPEELAERIRKITSLPKEEKERLGKSFSMYVHKYHSLDTLITHITNIIYKA